MRAEIRTRTRTNKEIKDMLICGFSLGKYYQIVYNNNNKESIRNLHLLLRLQKWIGSMFHEDQKKDCIMPHFHKKFIIEQVKVLPTSYKEGHLTQDKIEKTIGIGKNPLLCLAKTCS
jgi:hypothetical protein